ncbi:hypothetical protein Skr01_58790 [Sphaerisporangium krabiense]|uniref:Secreted protein n=1 Tax=Sphaerisporangium krabiense TaxID=763782 RepID=A0A7W8Z8M3_9ACTN|nr:hypothetical protein [Sphaerisporangium krabiense]MBB5629355.1 hypothetical protein [Sphaerisporangium krabiense]GII65794.1 hypothetical protein Skr01_58790 [Sphaerisporangium krabiense]
MKTKKVLLYLAIAFAVFYTLSRPADAANAVDGIFQGVSSGAGQLATFFTRLLN